MQWNSRHIILPDSLKQPAELRTDLSQQQHYTMLEEDEVKVYIQLQELEDHRICRQQGY